MTAERRPGFGAGFVSMFSGAGFLLRTPAAWPFALVPMLLLVVSAALLGWGAVAGVAALLDGWLGAPSSWYGKAFASLLGWIGSLLGIVLALLVALAITPPLAGPALERIVGLVEKDLGAPVRAPSGFWVEMWCALRAQALAALFATPLLGLLWIVDVLFAPSVLVTIPLKLLVSALAVAWNLLDYPLTLRGVRMSDRLRLVLSNKLAALGFGLGFALLFWLPCFGVLMLPVGVAGATRILWRILESNRQLLPALPRRDLNSDPPRSRAGA